jgi:hypothetical protein
VLDTAGALRKVVVFEEPKAVTTTKIKKIANGGYALTAGDSLGILADSNGKTFVRVPMDYNKYWCTNNDYSGYTASYGFTYNNLWPLEDGGLLYMIPRSKNLDMCAGIYTFTRFDLLVKIDGNTGKILWKLSIEIPSPYRYGDTVENIIVQAITTSPNGDLYIGGWATIGPSPYNYYPSFIFKISNVGHIYDPIPQASPTATKPQWQERKTRLSIFPSPAKRGESFTYSLPADKAGGVLEIFSADGRKVYSQTISQSSGSVSVPAHLQAGLYLVRASGLDAKWVVEN